MTIDNEPKGSTVSAAVDVSSADAAAAPQRRKKRKWDQPADSLVSAGVVLPIILPLPHMLPAVGFSHPGTPATLLNPLVPPNVAQPKIQDEVIAREIVINDAEASLRYKLTKRQTQDEIQKCSGAIVITRGKYRPPNAVTDGEKPLYLHISAGSHLKEMAEKIIAVDRAAAMVEEMLKPNNILQPFSTTHASGNVVCQPLSACVFLGFDADPDANIASRIRGPNDQYINHIMNETGATVILRGRSSRNIVGVHSEEEQPLHLFISSNNSKSLEDARLLAENLLDTISMEFGASRVSSLKVYNAVPPPQHLLPAALISSCGSEGKVTSSNPNGTPFVGSPSPSLSLIPGITAANSNGVISQPGFINNLNYSLACGTSYNGYSGLYSQATPLQQVSFAHMQPSITDTSFVGSSYSRDSNTDARSTAHLDKNPPRRRKFKELPIATQDSTQEHQGFLRESVADANAKHISVMPAPKKLAQSSSSGMPPPPPRDMPPPPPKFTSSKLASKMHEQNSAVLLSKTVPDPLVKLMEYGDDDDDDEDSVDRNQESSQNRQATPATPKPFWSL